MDGRRISLFLQRGLLVCDSRPRQPRRDGDHGRDGGDDDAERLEGPLQAEVADGGAGRQGPLRRHEHRTIKHEFVVIRTDKPAGTLLKGNDADESGVVGELDGVKAGNARVLVLNLKRGHCALICSLPGHYKTGQFADFYVR